MFLSSLQCWFYFGSGFNLAAPPTGASWSRAGICAPVQEGRQRQLHALWRWSRESGYLTCQMWRCNKQGYHMTILLCTLIRRADLRGFQHCSSLESACCVRHREQSLRCGSLRLCAKLFCLAVAMHACEWPDPNSAGMGTAEARAAKSPRYYTRGFA